MAGRKSLAQQLPHRQFLPIQVYNITHQPVFARGAKREIRDEKGKVVFDGRKTRVSTPFMVYKMKINDLKDDLLLEGFSQEELKISDKTEIIQNYESTFYSPPIFVDKDTEKKLIQKLEIENRVKGIKFQEQRIDLPKQCPSCERIGTPSFIRDRRKEVKQKRIRLIYNHSTKPKSCLIGEFTKIYINKKNSQKKKMRFALKLKKGLDPEKIGYHYWLYGKKERRYDDNLVVSEIANNVKIENGKKRSFTF